MKQYKNETRNDVSGEMTEVYETSNTNKKYVDELKRLVNVDMDGMFKAKNQTEFNAFFIDLKVRMSMLSELMTDFAEYRSRYVGNWFVKSKPYFRFSLPKVDKINSTPKDPSEEPIYTGGLEVALRKLSQSTDKEDRDEWLNLIDKWFVEAEKMYKKREEDRTAEIEEIRKICYETVEVVKDNYLTNQAVERTTRNFDNVEQNGWDEDLIFGTGED